MLSRVATKVGDGMSSIPDVVLEPFLDDLGRFELLWWELDGEEEWVVDESLGLEIEDVASEDHDQVLVDLCEAELLGISLL